MRAGNKKEPTVRVQKNKNKKQTTEQDKPAKNEVETHNKESEGNDSDQIFFEK